MENVATGLHNSCGIPASGLTCAKHATLRAKMTNRNTTPPQEPGLLTTSAEDDAGNFAITVFRTTAADLRVVAPEHHSGETSRADQFPRVLSFRHGRVGQFE